jgi:hypothetical protein
LLVWLLVNDFQYDMFQNVFFHLLFQSVACRHNFINNITFELDFHFLLIYCNSFVNIYWFNNYEIMYLIHKNLNKITNITNIFCSKISFKLLQWYLCFLYFSLFNYKIIQIEKICFVSIYLTFIHKFLSKIQYSYVYLFHNIEEKLFIFNVNNIYLVLKKLFNDTSIKMKL